MAIEVIFTATSARYDRIRAFRTVPIPAWPSDPLDDFDRAGLWVEVRDASNKVVYRRVLYDTGAAIEGPGDKPDQFVKVATPQRAPLHVIVPEVANGRVILMASNLPGHRAMPAIDAALPAV